MAQIAPHDIIRRPVITEQSMDNMGRQKYTFEVRMDATKPQIRQAVEELFDVKVAKVNTMRVPGKRRRMGVHTGYTPAWKKAVVSIKEGSIDFFEDLV